MRADAVERLLRKGRTPLGGVAPRYGDLGLPNVMATALRALRVRPPSPPIPEPFLDPDLLRGARTVVVLAVDGLGYLQLRAAKRRLGGLALLDAAQDGALFPITATVPSTTVSGIGSLCTAVAPVAHGLIGYRLFLREFGTVVNMIRFAPVDRSAPPFNPAGFVPVPTAFELAARARVRSFVLTREPYVGSALSQMLHRGATAFGYVTVSDFAVRLRDLLARRGRKLVFAYWDAIDTLCHRFGTETDEFFSEVATLDHVLEREVWRRTKEALVLVTADHGHVNTYEDGRFDLRSVPELLDALAVPPAGEPRLTYLHAKDGNGEALLYLANEVLDGRARGCTARDAFEAGVFGSGEPPPSVRERVGDVVLAPMGSRTLIYGYPGERVDLIGRHGGLSPEEMLVPFLLARL